MTSIQNKAKSVVIGTEEFPKNVLSFKSDESTGIVTIKRLNDLIVVTNRYDEFTLSGTPYASLSALQTALTSFLFA